MAGEVAAIACDMPRKQSPSSATDAVEKSLAHLSTTVEHLVNC